MSRLQEAAISEYASAKDAVAAAYRDAGVPAQGYARSLPTEVTTRFADAQEGLRAAGVEAAADGTFVTESGQAFRAGVAADGGGVAPSETSASARTFAPANDSVISEMAQTRPADLVAARTAISDYEGAVYRTASLSETASNADRVVAENLTNRAVTQLNKLGLAPVEEGGAAVKVMSAAEQTAANARIAAAEAQAAARAETKEAARESVSSVPSRATLQLPIATDYASVRAALRESLSPSSWSLNGRTAFEGLVTVRPDRTSGRRTGARSRRRF
jgi:hypothetical protein